LTRAKHISKERVKAPNGIIDTRAIQTSLDKLVDNVNLISANPLGRARLIEDVTVASGQTTIIKHGLGRELQGYIVVLSSVSSVINDLQSTNTRKTTELWIETTVTTVVNLLVF